MSLKLSFLLLTVAFCGPAPAEDGAIQWDTRKPVFIYFTEAGTPDREAWAGLTPAEQKEQFEAAEKKAAERRQQVGDFFSAMQRKWSLQEAQSNINQVRQADIDAVSVWLGKDRGAAVSGKLADIKRLVQKASGPGLEEADLYVLDRHLQPEAVMQFRSIKLAKDQQAAAAKKKKGAEWQGKTSGGLKKLAGVKPVHPGQDQAGKYFDGGGGKYYERDSSAVGISGKGPKTAAAAKLKGVPAATTVKTAAPAVPAGPGVAYPKGSLEKPLYKQMLEGAADTTVGVFTPWKISERQEKAQEQKLVDEGIYGVGAATRKEHQKITSSLGIVGPVVSLGYDMGLGALADCTIGAGCDHGSGAMGKMLQIAKGTKVQREVGGGYYTRTELACAGLGDLLGDMDAITFGLTKMIPMPSRCLKKNGK